MPAASKRDGARASSDVAAAGQSLDYGSGGCRMQEAARAGMNCQKAFFSPAIELVGSSDLGPVHCSGLDLRFREREVFCALLFLRQLVPRARHLKKG